MELGKWAVTEDGCDGSVMIALGDRDDYARVFGDEALELARLIAAAPALLAALKALRMVATHSDEFGTTAKEFDAIMTNAESAIAEAEGRVP